VLREAFRVLKPGGRFAVSDVIVRGQLPPSVRASLALWSGCIAGALDGREFIDILTETGFEAASIAVTREYSLDDATAILAADERTVDIDPATISGRLTSAFVRARKPAAAP
jgi:arsenite methyltransferase